MCYFCSDTRTFGRWRKSITIPRQQSINDFIDNVSKISDNFNRTTQATAIKDNQLFGIEFDMDLYIALFFASLFRKEGIRYQFLDKWTLDKMNETTVLLPCGSDGNPDWKSIRKLVKDIYDKMV
ncbi:MAG: hypothetical protein SPL42_10580 [Bacteroidales bacterium]|nr:hypothetical protein [Bacteroidales bacterium]